jgi:hypothetical protein
MDFAAQQTPIFRQSVHLDCLTSCFYESFSRGTILSAAQSTSLIERLQESSAPALYRGQQIAENMSHPDLRVAPGHEDSNDYNKRDRRTKHSPQQQQADGHNPESQRAVAQPSYLIQWG